MGVIAEGTLNPDDFLRGIQLMWRKQPISLMLPAIGGLILLATVVNYVWGEASVGGLVKGVLIGCFMLAVSWLAPRLGSRNLQKNSPALQGNALYDFHESGYHFRSPHADSFVKWDLIVAWAEDSHSFVLYTAPNAANIVPKRFFADAAAMEAARELFARVIRKKK